MSLYDSNREWNREKALELMMDKGWTKYDIVKEYPTIWQLGKNKKLFQISDRDWMDIRHAKKKKRKRR